MTQIWVALGSLLMLLGVAAGAFAAHGLKAHLSADNLDIWQTGARYHIYHALALFAVAFAATRWQSSLISTAGWLFVAGVAVFAGSLYLLAVTNVKWLGAITPIGGLCFLAGWACLALGALRG